ncbi:hypothetical protein OF83DRAFT_1131104 [Amylostereum chailletii]|nr:hypothetical protein OF83DRAFT_1131104 [Amylostereum chailletii]
MQRFSQSTNEYKDTEFVDDDGYPVFRTVTTPKRFGPKDTAIERATTDTESKTAAWAPVAAIEYHEWRPTRFRFQGRDVEFNKYMEKKGWWGGCVYSPRWRRRALELIHVTGSGGSSLRVGARTPGPRTRPHFAFVHSPPPTPSRH